MFLGHTYCFEQIFIKHCGDARPQLLIWDFHRSDESLEILIKASENNINIFAFPPHTIYPLRICPFGRTVLPLFSQHTT